MADTHKFVSDFRGAISAMLDDYDHVTALVSQHQAMGWTEADFTNSIGSTDITAADFEAAVTACGGLAAGFASLAHTLAKMRS